MTFDFNKFRTDLLARVDAQYPRKRDGSFTKDADRAALELLCGAAMALEQTDRDTCSRMLNWAFICSARGVSFIAEKQEAA